VKAMFAARKMFSVLFTPNPIVIKELRQIVRSRYIVGILFLFLLVQLVATGIALLTTSTLSILNLDAALRAGREMFQILIVILTGACLLFIPSYTGHRLAMERNVSNMDLLFVTTIRPGAIIRGKLLAGMTITVLMFSATAPFMSFTYLLRGIDLPSIFVVLAFNFLVVIAAIELAMCLACVPASKPFKTLIGLAFTAGMITATTTLAVIESEMIDEGIGSQLRSWDFWQPALIVLGILVSISGFLHVFSISMISPSSSNRALPIRIYLAILWLIWGGVAIWAAIAESDADIIFAWLIPFIVLLSMGILAAISENPVPSNRIRRNIPKRRVFARVAFLFYTGPAGGIISNVLLVALTFCISVYCWSLIGHKAHYSSFEEVTEVMIRTPDLG